MTSFHDAKFEEKNACVVFLGNHDRLTMFSIVFGHIGEKSFEVTKFL